MANVKPPGKTRLLAEGLIHAAMRILRDNGREMPIREVMARVEKEVDLSDWAKERFEKSGYIRWQSILHFYSIDCVKAGYLVKKKGVWYLTPEGEEAIEMGPAKLLDSATRAYRKWRAEQPSDTVPETDDAAADETSMAFEEVEQVAISGFEHYIGDLNAYEFQDLVAALLRGMGYYTPFIAPRGKDGGVDVMAYRDPLGTQSPRIQVQIKHRGTPASVQEVRQLMGLLQKEGDVGIFVSTGGFTPDAKTTARGSHVHVELIDLPRFITLWQEFYDKMSDTEKSLMPLTPIYFLAKKE
ncbi:MAG: restriction endonuclease [Deltaproteobacteria bacterium]|nr:restriction endonuclease [Deltaproteobacteria bacterium]